VITIQRQAFSEVVAGAVAFAAVGGLAADNGGFFPTSWGWASVALFLVAVALLVVGGMPQLRPLEMLVLGATGALSVWIFVSSAWSVSVTRSMLEGERSLVYVGGALVALLLSRRAGGRAIVIGTWLAVWSVCTYSLLTRLFPRQFGVSADALAGNRLSAPVGYWNGLALFAAVGVLLALGLAARAHVALRMAAAASAIVLTLTLYFTFGRGGWIALFVGFVVAVVIDRRRGQLLLSAGTVVPWLAIGVYVASRATALTHVNATQTAAEKDGHAVAAIAAVLMSLAAFSALLLESFERRRSLTAGPRVRRAAAGILLCFLAAALVAAVVRYGSPASIARGAWHSFTTSPGAEGSNLNGRLFHLSGTGRIAHWRVAAREVAAQPFLGSGAGTFGEYWFKLRPSADIVHDAHTLYLETLAEIGPVGLALVVLILAGLFAGAVRSRSPLASLAAGAVVAYAFHSAADWDWELPALLLAVALPALAVVEDPPARSPALYRSRLAPAAAAVALGGFALFGLLGNIALARSGNAADATHWKQAESEARSALGLVPWSAEPLRKLAVAQAGLGDIRGAQSSLRDAVAMEPADWSLWYQLSEVTTGAPHRRALARADRLDPRRTSLEATPGDLRLVIVP
jgi:hypothetical protein